MITMMCINFKNHECKQKLFTSNVQNQKKTKKKYDNLKSMKEFKVSIIIAISQPLPLNSSINNNDAVTI